VRNAQTQKFLRATGRWTKKAEAAFNFPNTVNALHTCLAVGAKEVEFILRFEGETADRRVQLRCA
jgi:hypothetical protein